MTDTIIWRCIGCGATNRSEAMPEQLGTAGYIERFGVMASTVWVTKCPRCMAPSQSDSTAQRASNE